MTSDEKVQADFGAWQETALITFSPQVSTAASARNIQFAAITETIDIDQGEKNFDQVALLNGGRLVKIAPETETTVTLEAYPLYAGHDGGIITGSDTTGEAFFDLLHDEDTGTDAVQISVSRRRTKYRLVMLWTDDQDATTATQQVVQPTNRALRFAAADGYITSVKPSFTDGILKFTVTYKVPPFDTAGTANIAWSSVGTGTGTVTMTALGSYTTTVKAITS